jgi:hypothetical protein
MMNLQRFRRSAAAMTAMMLLGAGSAYAQGTPVSRSTWSVHYVDSQDTLGGNYVARNAFDGNPDSLWVTEWYQSSPPPPHELQIDMGAVHSVNGFRYLPRQDGNINGTIGSYQFFVSADGVNWGSAVASGQFNASAQEKEVTFTAKSGRYVRLRAMTEVVGQPWSAVAELNVLAGTGGTSTPTPPTPPSTPANVVSKSNWRVHSVDSQDTLGGNHVAANAFDGNPATLWSTEWVTSAPTPPHDLVIDMAASYSLTGFIYLPRQDGSQNGRVAGYQIFVSGDASNWGAAVASGTFPNTATVQQVNFSAKTGRYVWFRATSEVNGQPWTTLAELSVIGTAAGGGSGGGSGGGGSTGQYPAISLSGTASGNNAVALSATSSDADGSIARVEFYSGSTRASTDTRAPYSATVSNLARGTYTFTAIAYDDDNNSTSSNVVTVTVGSTASTVPKRVVFAPSPDHDSLTQRYILEIFAAGANPQTATPRARLDLGVPSVTSGQCDVDISQLIASLPAGTYFGTVSAEGSGGSSRSGSSPQFVIN